MGPKKKAADGYSLQELEQQIGNLRKELNQLEIDEKQLLETVKSKKGQEEFLERESQGDLDEDDLFKYKLFKAMGVECKFADSKLCRIDFPTLNKDGSTSHYWVKINTSNKKSVKLQSYKLSPGLSETEIFEVAPLKKLSDIPNFLQSCKHFLLCFHDRKRQIADLKDKHKPGQNWSVDSGFDYLRITIRLTSVYDSETKKNIAFNIVLFYKYNQRLPWKNVVQPVIRDGKTKFDNSTQKILEKKFAKPFSKKDLSQAFEDMIESNKQPFIWNPDESLSLSRSQHDNEDSDSSSKNTEEDNNSIDEFLEELQKTKSKKRKRKEKAPPQVSSLNSENDENEKSEVPEDTHPKKKKKVETKTQKRKYDAPKKNISRLSSASGSKVADPKQSTLNFSKMFIELRNKDRTVAEKNKLSEQQKATVTPPVLSNKKGGLLKMKGFASSTPMASKQQNVKKNKALQEVASITPIRKQD